MCITNRHFLPQTWCNILMNPDLPTSIDARSNYRIIHNGQPRHPYCNQHYIIIYIGNFTYQKYQTHALISMN